MEFRKSVLLTMKQILCRECTLGQKRVSPMRNLSEAIFYLEPPAEAGGRDGGARGESSILLSKSRGGRFPAFGKKTRLTVTARASEEPNTTERGPR